MSIDEPIVTDPVLQPDPPDARTDRLGLVFVAGLILFLGFSYSWYAVLMVAALAICIFLHELGHYLTAKAAGMKVTEFFLGFGPRIWSFRRGETEYGIKPIMLGAYVRIIGMSNLEEVDPADEARTYRSKPYWRRLSVAVAGSTMHLLIALVLIFTVFVGFGVEDASSSHWTVYVQPDSPAASAGMREGDRIVSLDGAKVGSFEEASSWLRARPGETVAVVVERDGEDLALSVHLASTHPSTGAHTGYLGVGPIITRARLGLVDGVARSVGETRSAIWQSIAGIGHLVSPNGVESYYDNVRGTVPPRADGLPDEGRPTSIVGIVQVGSQVAENGMVNLVYLLFFLNVFIGVFNLSPLLPFDGGHVVIATYEKIRSLITRREYRADVAKLMPLTYAVVALLGVLFITSAYLDVFHPVSLR
jgi:membrane-associated protease RseP (regulator of RpoE activity)